MNEEEKLKLEQEAAERKAAEEAAAEASKESEKSGEKPGVSDAEAKLMREVMQKKEKVRELETRLRTFEGINPDEVRALLAEKKKAEEEALEKRGEFDRLKARMAEEHQTELKAVKDQFAEITNLNQSLNKTIEELTVGQAFSSSNFISQDTVLTPSKARIIYGSHFDIEGGQIVAYDKPRGASERTKLVDARGAALPFEDALKRIVDADPDKDTMIRSKAKAGAESKTETVKVREKAPELRGRDRIAAALSAASKKK